MNLKAKKMCRKISCCGLFVLTMILYTYNGALAQQDQVSSDELYQLAMSETRESKNYEKALQLSKKGLELSPGNADIRTLMGRLYFLTGDTAMANKQYKKVLATDETYYDALIGQGSLLRSTGKYKKAASNYRKVLEEHPDDTPALYGLAASYFEMEQYDSVLTTTNRGLQKDPQNEWMLNLKIGALEKMEHYQKAVAAAETYLEYYPDKSNMRNYAGRLKRKASRNRVGIGHKQFFYDTQAPTTVITSFQYQRSLPGNSSIGGYIDYARRQQNDGLQLKVESYLSHNDRYYSYAMAGLSNQRMFPKWRAGYSLFRQFKKGWEGEVGTRLLRTEDVMMYFGTWAVGKYWGNNWLNVRGYVVHDGGKSKWHQSYVLTGRHYLSDKHNFLTFILGTGTSPDDRNRNFQYNSFSTFISQYGGIGYQKTLGDLTTISLHGLWLRQQIADNRHLNRLDVYISVTRNF